LFAIECHVTKLPLYQLSYASASTLSIISRRPPNRSKKALCAKLNAPMQKITVQLTAEELQALVTLTENQFFRIKYLDPKMPGYKGRPKEVEAAQSAVHVLQTALRKEKGFKDLAATK
jgi:hypothetical protein